MGNVVIDKNEVVVLLHNQFDKIKSDNYNLYKDINFVIEDEMQFNKIKDKSPNTIYMVVKFSAATFNFGQTTQNFTIEVLTEQNSFELTQRFLIEYVTKYNLVQSADGKIVQAYTTPAITTNFNYVYDGFRSVLSINGTLLVVSQNNIYVEKLIYHYVDEKGVSQQEEVDFTSFVDDTTNQLNSQPYGNSNGRTKSYATIQTYTFSVNVYSVECQLIKDVIASRYLAESGANREFEFSLVLKNNISGFQNWIFKCAGIHYEQRLAQLSTYSFTFTL